MQVVNPAAIGVGRLVGRLERTRPIYVLAPLCVGAWVIAIAFAFHIKHNGWLYYSGGDGTYYWTTTWALAHHILPETVISYGLPVFGWPLALIFGSSLLASLPVIVVLQVGLLAPLAVVGIYAVARRIGGQLFAFAAALLWVLSPLIAYHVFYTRVRYEFGGFVLPSLLGLNNLADYSSMVLTIVVAWLTLRALEERRWNDVVLAGLLCGFLIAVKPANGFFLPAPFAALLVGRAWRQALVFGAAMVPALLTLTIWKHAGLGTVPLFGAVVVRTAMGANDSFNAHVSTYLPFHWHDFTNNLSEIREYTWSLRLAEWVPIAGLIGAARRGWPHATLLGLWCFDFLVIKGGTNRASVYNWSYFRLTLPGFPAYLLLACCIVFLIPGLGRKWKPGTTPYAPFRLSRGLIAVAAVFAVYPLIVVLAHGPAAHNRVAIDTSNNTVPVTSDLHVHVVQTAAGPSLRWKQPNIGSSKVGYVVLRAVGSTGCPAPNPTHECHLGMPTLRLVHSLNFPAWQFGPGIYRVGLVAGPHIQREDGDLLLLSPPIQVH